MYSTVCSVLSEYLYFVLTKCFFSSRYFVEEINDFLGMVWSLILCPLLLLLSHRVIFVKQRPQSCVPIILDHFDIELPALII